MGQDVMNLSRLKVRQDGDSDRPHCRNGKKRYPPLGSILTQQGNSVACDDPAVTQQRDHRLDVSI